MVSVDENFLNISWSGDIGGENDARGWMLLKHLSLWRDWNEAEGNPFYGKVDLSNIALVGHSRGGEAIMHAAAFNKLKHYPDDANVRFDFGFEIKSLVGIAPIDGQYKPAGQHVPIENVNYLVLQGSHDSDLDFFAGSRCFRRVKFTDGRYWMKASLYIYRANHGQFNTVWGKYDLQHLRHLLNIAPLLRGEEQRLIAKTYICAFLEATLHGDKRYIPMFRDHRVIADWLPETIYFNRFEDSKFRVVSNFDECIDIAKGTVSGGVQRARNLSTWRLQEMKGRGGWPFRDYAMVLGWNDPGKTDNDNDAAFALTLPDDLAQSWLLNKQSILVFSLADTDEEPKKQNPSSSESSSQGSVEMDDNAPVSQSHPPNANSNDPTQTTDKGSGEKEPIDLTIELTSADGYRSAVPLSEFFPIQPVLKVQFTKWGYWERTRYKSHTEPVLQTFEIPLSAFVQANPSFNPARLKTIEFRFDRTKSGVVILDQVGFTNRL